jgi:hypothetical protein
VSHSRVRVARLASDQIGQYGGVGWYFQYTGDSESAVVFQCPHNHHATLETHSIDTAGNVDASVLCFANCGYHQTVTLDEWPGLVKKRGEPWVTYFEVQP